MPKMPDMFSLDYSTAQWILSIIIGVCLTKVYSIIAHHIRYRKEITFYLSYLLLVAQTFILLIFVWFQSPFLYQVIEGNNLAFLAKVINDSIAVIFVLIALPDERMLNTKNLHLKRINYDSKKTWVIIQMAWSVGGLIIGVFTLAEGQKIMALGSIIIVLVPSILVLKFDNDYLHIGYHLFNLATLMTVFLGLF